MVKFLCRFPNWGMESFKEICKRQNITRADLVRLSTYFLIMEYKGKYDQDTLDRMEFKARTKIGK